MQRYVGFMLEYLDDSSQDGMTHGGDSCFHMLQGCLQCMVWLISWTKDVMVILVADGC